MGRHTHNPESAGHYVGVGYKDLKWERESKRERELQTGKMIRNYLSRRIVDWNKR